MGPQPRVLIVDDEERFRTTLARMLSAQGIEAAVAGSGPEALVTLRSHHFDVVLLDIRMPQMGGIETLAAIKKTAPQVEVIILTGHASVDAAMEIMKLGAHDYLLKPCPLDELLLKIDAAFEKKLEREKRRKE